MARIAWTPQARADVEAIYAYIARDSERSADLVAARIVHAVDRLAEFPRSGRSVPELGREDVREVIRGHYRIVYRYGEVADDVHVLTVFHGARLFPLADVLHAERDT